MKGAGEIAQCLMHDNLFRSPRIRAKQTLHLAGQPF